MKKIITLLLFAVIVDFTHASAATVNVLRVRGFNRTSPDPDIEGMQESDVINIKNFGGNVYRINMYYHASWGPFSTEWTKMRNSTKAKVQWCKNQGIKAVPCLSLSPWEESGVAYNSQAMWNRADLNSTFCQLWRDIVNDLAPNKDAVWAYDLYNEPLYGLTGAQIPPQWRQLAIDIINAIHVIDPNAWCVYETGPGAWINGFESLTPLPCTRVVYGAHFYVPQPFTHEDVPVSTPGVGTYRYPGTFPEYQGDLQISATANRANFETRLQVIRNFQTTYNVPIFMGEFSAGAGAQLPDSATWLTDVISIFEQWGWSWAYHGYRDAACWNIEMYDTQRKAAVLAGLANNSPADTDTFHDSVYPAAPSGLSATAVSSSQINLAWTDNASNETGYKIERKTGAGGTYGQIATVGANVTTYPNTGLSATTTYYYRVRANNGAGDSAFSNEANATTQGGAPAAPSGLTATAASSSQINLAWTDNANNETGFKIERKLGASGTFAQIATTGANITTYQNTALPASAPYYYRVRANNGSVNSAYSNEANATTTGSAITIPNFGFETPLTATYVYYPSGASWTFGGTAGVSANNSAFTSQNPNAPQGAQVAFLQTTSSISQGLGGFTPNTPYTVIFSGAQRVWGTSGQTWNVTINGGVIGSFAPPLSATNYVNYSAAFTASAASLTFGMNGYASGDNTVFIDNVRITPSSWILPSPWASADIGAVGATGGANYTGGTFTLTGSGPDIWGTADGFRYVYQSASGDCTIQARVTAVQNTDAWAKSGVMIRESLNANSRHVMSVITPGGGASFQRRVTTGGTTTETTTGALTAPIWLRVQRAGNTFTASRSADGSAWTTMGSVSVTMSSGVYIGLPISSHVNPVLCTATVDSVTATP